MSGWFKKLAATVAAFFRKHWKSLAGMGVYQIISWIYDNPLWMSVELAWKENGVIALMLGAMLINFGVLLYFRQKKVSWLCLDTGVDYIRESWLGRKLLGTSANGSVLENVIAFFLLSFFQDSFITTAYLRHGRSDGLKFQDIAVFFASSVVSISYWAIRNGLIVEVLFRPLLGL